MIQEAILELADGHNLSLDNTKDVMNSIMSGEATNAQIASFITAMRMKGETIDEITACAMVLREKCLTFHSDHDVLEALGVKIDLPADKSEKVLKQIGICFLFAPLYHSSMRFAGPVRKELGIRTLFNIIGPLANPAGANMQLLGVYDENLVEPLARVLANLGVKHAMVVHGHDGLDEASMVTSSTICEISNGRVNSFFLDPKQLGFETCQSEDLVGGDAAENAQITLDILTGKDRGPKRNAVLLNAALCIYMGQNKHTLRECVKMAGDIIDSGKAKAKLDAFVQITQKLSQDINKN